MKLKNDTVEMRITEPLFIQFLFVIDAAYRCYESELTITSGSELSSGHSRTSLHYSGRAVDVRSWAIQDSEIGAQSQYVMICEHRDSYLESLGIPTDTIDVVMESDHIHIEWQPKRQ